MRQIGDDDKAKLEFALKLLAVTYGKMAIKRTGELLTEVLGNMDRLCEEKPYTEPIYPERKA